MDGHFESREEAISIVAGTLRAYAARGVFQDLQMAPSKKAGIEFHFTWLYDQPFTLTCDLQRKRLALIDLLPGVQRGSMMYKELNTFLKSRSDADLPEHRRVDPQRGAVTSRMRDKLVSIELTLLGQEYEYGTRKLINIGHEVFLFLSQYWADYMWKTFRLNME
jgi:hypothetical protein